MRGRLLTYGLLGLLVAAESCVAPAAIRADVAVEEIGSITGRAVDTLGTPVSGVSVTTVPASGGLAKQATTNSDGTYRFEVPAGTYRIDFETLGFDVTRRNDVRVRHHGVTHADGVLHVSGICECITMVPPKPLAVRSGQVVDAAARPLPHARVEVVSPTHREVAYADADGRFLLKAPVDASWPVTASDTGYRAVVQEVSGSVQEPIVFRLAYAGTAGVPLNERFSRACRCPGDLFTHRGH